MEKFKDGDLCVVINIGQEDAHFGQKEKLIGKKVIFRWYELSLCKTAKGGIGCMLYFADEFEDKGHSIHKAICFGCVKLKKVV